MSDKSIATAAQTPRKVWTLILILFSVLLVSSISSLIIGPLKIPVKEILLNLIGADENSVYSSVLFSIRLPRISAAILAGWGLGLAGLCYQSLLKNALASEYTLGIASGAAIGAVLASLLKFQFFFSTPLFAFLGSMSTMLIVFSVARRKFLSDTYSLVLTGIILTAFGNALLSLLLSILSPNQLHAFFFWFMGSFAAVQWLDLIRIAPWIAMVSLVIFFYSWEMNAISLNEEMAQQVGIPVVKTKLILYVCAGLLTALIVSLAGTIGFIGLVVPHLGRLLIGADNRSLVFIVPLLGATFCILSDLVARLVLSPAELPVGVVTAFIGVPVFLYFMAQRKI
ncbi:iron ABC transporter permease [bacterium]|nr:iron ABC transporter permease [bacterium]